jgi:hypothetical protein
MKKYFFAIGLILILIFGGCGEAAKSDNPEKAYEPHELGKPPEWSWYIGEPYAIIRINEITDEITEELWHRNYPERLDSAKVNCSILYSNASVNLIPQSGDGSVPDETVVPPFDSVTEIYIPTRSIGKIKDNDIIMIKVLWTPRYDPEKNVDDLYYAPELDDDGNAEFFAFNDNKIVIDEESKKMKSYYSIDGLNSYIDQVQRMLGNDGEIKPLENGMTFEEVKEFFIMANIAKAKYMK